jgi:hypothetical protein
MRQWFIPRTSELYYFMAICIRHFSIIIHHLSVSHFNPVNALEIVMKAQSAKKEALMLKRNDYPLNCIRSD